MSKPKITQQMRYRESLIKYANKQLQEYLKEYNNFPMQPLNWRSPNELLRDYFNLLK